MNVRVPGFLQLFSGGVAVSLGFIVVRFLLAPVRIRVLTEVMTPSDYGIITLLSMSATAMAFIFSLGGFESWLKQLPHVDHAKRLGLLRSLLIPSTLAGLAGAAIILAGRAPRAWYGDDLHTLPSLTVAIFFLLFLHIHQRIYFLLGCGEHRRARLTQLLWGDLWFLILLPAGFSVQWPARQILCIWCGWMILSTLLTWRWVPVTACMRADSRNYVDYRFSLSGISMLPLIMSEWVFRLGGQYILLAFTDATTMALYALTLNIALVGMAAGVPLVDVFMAQRNKLDMSVHLTGEVTTVSSAEASLFSEYVHLILALSLVMGLAMIFLGHPVVEILAASTFHAVAEYLPLASAIPGLMLMNLLLGRFALRHAKGKRAAFASVTGSLAGLALGVMLVERHHVAGVLVATTGGLVVTLALLGWFMGVWQWVSFTVVKLLRFAAGGTVLGLLFMFCDALPVPALIKLTSGAGVSLLVVLLFRWVTIRDSSMVSRVNKDASS